MLAVGSIKLLKLAKCGNDGHAYGLTSVSIPTKAMCTHGCVFV